MPWAVAAAVGGALITSSATSSAADTAAGAQTAASDASIAEQRRQFDKMRELLAPYTEAGYGSLEQQQALLGLGGADAQQQAISGIEQSPLYQSLARQGEEAMLQQASATGGLRGGNIQGALAQYRPQLLNQLINQRYGQLSGLSQMGQNSAAGVGAAGMNMANQIGNQYGQIGAAQAGNALAQGQALGGIGSTITSLGTMAALNPTLFSGFGTGNAAEQFSDIRLKNNIEFTHSENGINFYTWEWNNKYKELIGEDSESVGKGVLAQEIMNILNSAVTLGEDGYYMVDYNKVNKHIEDGGK